VLAIEEISRGFDFQAEFANKLWRVCITTKRRRVLAYRGGDNVGRIP
jgi:hypothetical protein